METHVKVLGILYIVFSALGLIAALIAFVVMAGAGLASGEAEALAASATIGTILAVLMLILSLPGLIVGFGLLKRKEWARILGIIVGAINLINIPLGTILGIYTLWALLNQETVKLFTSAPAAAAPGAPPAPAA